MKTIGATVPLVLVAMLVTGCSGLVSLGRGAKTITPSDVSIAETRDVSDFSGIDMHTFGRIVLTQGDSESLTITGRDNLVPLVRTSVRDGVLIIEMEENVNVVSAHPGDLLAFDIKVKDLNALTVSGLAKVEMETLTTSVLAVTMSGTGEVRLDQLAAKSLNIRVSGLGNVEVVGEAAHAIIEISGAGEVRAADLRCQTADVTVPGLGSATVWVTDALTGKISGAGNVSYYGDPETNTETTGLGSFKALGDK